MNGVRPVDAFEKREDLLRCFRNVREATEHLCEPLSHEDHLVSVTADTSPPKWHLAHTSWFFENFILVRHKRGYEPFKPEFNFLFNSYYRRAGSYLPKDKRNVISRPSIEEVYQYRHQVDREIQALLMEMPESDYARVRKLLEIGVNHEEQHQELLLMDVKRNFFENPTRPQYYNHQPSGPSHMMSDPHWLNLPSGPVKIGVGKNDPKFSYDNERDAHTQWIESCMLSSHLVTNDEYLAFIDEGGYDNPQYWLSDGWDLKEREGWQHPLYWEKQGQSWWVYTHSGMMPLDLSAPVCHVSYYEAQAFAHWKGCRLPTEGEWEVAARQEPLRGIFMEDGEYEPLPSDDEHELFSQIHGTVWEWTQSAFLPYPRFEKFQHGLSEYNEKFMCNQFVLRGGSSLTPRRHYRPTYRNFYYPHMRWQCAGIRLAKDLA